jgi:pantetheine-phosphate adenylyltransferase
MRNTIALYCGTFSPFHIGHLNIVRKSLKIFDNLTVAFGHNPTKPQTDTVSRSEELKAKLEKLGIRCQVTVYSTFLHELIEEYENKGFEVVLIRGLRNGDDLDYEDNQLKYIRDFKKDINVVFIRCDEEYEHISSSSIRSLESFRPGSAKKYLL